MKKTIAFIDINNFSYEGFSSGMLITVREILRRFYYRGFKTHVFSITQKKTVGNQGISNLDKSKEVDYIKVHEDFLPENPEKLPNIYASAIRKAFKQIDPNVILLNTPAVFFDESHVLALQTALEAGKPVLVLLVDTLFPTVDSHDERLVKRYYELLRKAKVISTSHKIIELFYDKTNIKARYFLNLFVPDEIVSKNPGSHKFITMINTHPIKGREIFDEIALMMPEKQFLIVQNWPDVPPYIPISNNVTFSNFVTDVSKLYEQIRILLVPSLCQEGPARVITEAMLNGIPVIANKIGSISEIGGRYVYLIDPPTEIKEVMEGTIITPVLKKKDKVRMVNDYVIAIKSIDVDQSAWEKNSEIAQQVALQFCKEGDKEFNNFIGEIENAC